MNRLKVIVTRAFDDSLVEKKCTIFREEQNGFDCASGAWSKYKLFESDTPATFLIVRYYRKKHLSRINKKNIVEIR